MTYDDWPDYESGWQGPQDQVWDDWPDYEDPNASKGIIPDALNSFNDLTVNQSIFGNEFNKRMAGLGLSSGEDFDPDKSSYLDIRRFAPTRATNWLASLIPEDMSTYAERRQGASKTLTEGYRDFIKGTGEFVENMFTPLNIATFGAGAGAKAVASPQLAKGLTYAERALSYPIVGSGLGKVINPEATWPERATGAVETVFGALGARAKVPEPRLGGRPTPKLGGEAMGTPDVPTPVSSVAPEMALPEGIVDVGGGAVVIKMPTQQNLQVLKQMGFEPTGLFDPNRYPVWRRGIEPTGPPPTTAIPEQTSINPMDEIVPNADGSISVPGKYVNDRNVTQGLAGEGYRIGRINADGSATWVKEGGTIPPAAVQAPPVPAPVPAEIPPSVATPRLTFPNERLGTSPLNPLPEPIQYDYSGQRRLDEMIPDESWTQPQLQDIPPPRQGTLFDERYPSGGRLMTEAAQDVELPFPDRNQPQLEGFEFEIPPDQLPLNVPPRGWRQNNLRMTPEPGVVPSELPLNEAPPGITPSNLPLGEGGGLDLDALSRGEVPGPPRGVPPGTGDRMSGLSRPLEGVSVRELDDMLEGPPEVRAAALDELKARIQNLEYGPGVSEPRGPQPSTAVIPEGPYGAPPPRAPNAPMYSSKWDELLRSERGATDIEEMRKIFRAMRLRGSLPPGEQTGRFTTFPSTKFDYYRGPNGEVLPVQATASKGQKTISFTTREGKQVDIELIRAAEETDPFGRPKLGSPLLRDADLGDYVREVKDRTSKIKGNFDEEGFGKLINDTRDVIKNEKDPTTIKDNLNRMNAQYLEARRRGTNDEQAVMYVIWKAAKDRHDEIFGAVKQSDMPPQQKPPSLEGQKFGPQPEVPPQDKWDVPVPGERGELQSFNMPNEPRPFGNSPAGQIVKNMQLTGNPELDAMITRMKEIANAPVMTSDMWQELRELGSVVTRHPNSPPGFRQQYYGASAEPSGPAMDPRMAARVEAGGPREFDYSQVPPEQGQLMPMEASSPQARAQQVTDAINAAQRRLGRRPEVLPEQLSMEGQMKDAEIADYLRREDATPPEGRDLYDQIKGFMKGEQGAVPLEDIKGAAVKGAKYAGIAVKEAYELSRALSPTSDFSFAFRQGLPLAGTKAWNQAWAPAAKTFGSDKAFDLVMKEIKNKPLFRPVFNPKTAKFERSFAERAGVDLTDLNEALSRREEMMQSRLMKKVPWISHTNRMYTGFLNSLRANHFENLIKDAEAQGLKPKEDMVLARQIADFVNTATGRAPLRISFLGEAEHSLEGAATVLSNTLFAPRLLMSRARMLSPGTYIHAAPFVRKQYLKAMSHTAGAWIGVATLGSLAGADVSLDPTSADFGKVKIGNFRLDPAGGFQQPVVTFMRGITGYYTSSASGRSFELGQGFRAETRGSVTQRFFENKLHPSAKFFWDLGHATGYQPVYIKDRLMQMYIPMIMQDAMELSKEDPALWPMIAPLALGMGAQIYEAGETPNRFIPKREDIRFTGGSMFGRHPFRPGGALFR